MKNRFTLSLLVLGLVAVSTFFGIFVSGCKGKKTQNIDLPSSEEKELLQADYETATKFTMRKGQSGYVIVRANEEIDRNLVLPSTFRGVPVVRVSTSAFARNKGILTVECDKNLTAIGQDAFYGCSSLQSFSAPGVTSLGQGCFWQCVDLDYTSFPKCASIGDETFFGCSSLVGFDFSKDLVSIGYAAFSETGLRSVEIPENTYITETNNKGVVVQRTIERTIGSFAFEQCHDLQEVSILASDVSFGTYVFFGCTITKLSTCQSVIADEFSEAKILSFVMNEGVEVVSGELFYEDSSILSISVPSSVYSIAQNAFKDCNNLVEFINLSGISKDVQNAYNKESLIVNSTDANDLGTFEVAGPKDEFVFYTKADGTKYLVADLNQKTTRTEVVLPTDVGDFTITTKVYRGNTHIKRIVLGDNVVGVNKQAFMWCENIDDVTIGSGLKTIGEYAFAFDANLNFDSNLNLVITYSQHVTSLNLNYDAIGTEWDGAKNYLETLVIGNNTKTISSNAFKNSIKLKQVVVGENVSEIGSNAFDGCGALATVINHSKYLTFVAGSTENGKIAEHATEVVNDAQ